MPAPALWNGIGRIAPWRGALRDAPYALRGLGFRSGSGTWLWRPAKPNAVWPLVRATPRSQVLTQSVTLLCLSFGIDLALYSLSIVQML